MKRNNTASDNLEVKPPLKVNRYLDLLIRSRKYGNRLKPVLMRIKANKQTKQQAIESLIKFNERYLHLVEGYNSNTVMFHDYVGYLVYKNMGEFKFHWPDFAFPTND